MHLALLFCVIFGIHSSALAVPILSFDVSDDMPAIGDTITVDIIIADSVDLYIYTLDIGFDESILDVDTVTAGPFLSGGGLTLDGIGAFSFDTSTPGEIQNINDSILGPISGVNGDGEYQPMEVLSLMHW